MSRPLPIADNLEYGTSFFFLFPIRAPRNPIEDNLHGISRWRGGHLRSFQLSERPTLFLLCTEHILGYFIEIEDVLCFPNHSLRSSTGRISTKHRFGSKCRSKSIITMATHEAQQTAPLEYSASENAAAIMIQKTYRGYRARRKLADAAIMAKQYGW